jgi:hypothetical protein
MRFRTMLAFNEHEEQFAYQRSRPGGPRQSRSFQGRSVDGGGHVSKIVDANVERCRNVDSDLLYTADPPQPMLLSWCPRYDIAQCTMRVAFDTNVMVAALRSRTGASNALLRALRLR